MRRILSAVVLPILFLTSCSINKVAVGDAYPDQPLKEVSSQRNHFFIGGLVRGGKNDLKATDYVGDRENYVVKTKTTFVNGVVGFFTFGIYTPTTTTFYAPANEYSYEDEFRPNVRRENPEHRRFGDREARYNSNDRSEEFRQDDYRDRPIRTNAGRDFNRRDSRAVEHIEDFDYLEERSIEQPNVEEVEEPVIEEQVAPQSTRARIDSYQQPTTRDYNRRVQIQAEEPAPAPINNEYRNYNNRSVNNSTALTPTKAGSTGGEYKAVIYFKNGAKMNGTITEHPSGDVTIKLPGGTTMESKMKDIERIERK